MNDPLQYKSPCIFIADDDDDDVYFVRTALKEIDAGITLKHFSNGRLLLNALRSAGPLPNFVLLDLNMPVLDGRETLRMIRKKHDALTLPVVVFSTSNHDHEKSICFEYGANTYLTKPCTYPRYLEIVRHLKGEWIDRVLA